MRIIGQVVFSMLRNQSGWNLMHCFSTFTDQSGRTVKWSSVTPSMLSEIKRRPIKETLNKKIKNE